MQADAPLAWYVENTLGRLNRNLKKHLRAPRDNRIPARLPACVIHMLEEPGRNRDIALDVKARIRLDLDTLSFGSKLQSRPAPPLGPGGPIDSSVKSIPGEIPYG